MRTRKFFWPAIAAVTALLVMVGPMAAFADTVTNDVTAGGSDTFTAAGSTAVNYKINATGGDGQTGCNASDGSNATVTINAPTGVTATPGSLVFNYCGNPPQGVVFSSSIPGDYAITASVSDSGAGSYNTTPSGFTLHVLVAPPSDTTPPVITPNVVGTLGNNGWYTSDVTVSWTVVDDESAISSSSGCDSTTIDSDTAGTTLTCTATSEGGTAQEEVTIKRDATAPTIGGTASPAANANGWNNTDVMVSYGCGDNLSGVASCGPDETLSAEGAGQSSSGTAVDNAGNSAMATVSGINIDKTAPVVAVTGVSDGGVYTLGSVPDAGCSTSDALSGVQTDATLSGGYTGGVGPFTAYCLGALDNADNPGSASASFTVIYDFDGFFRPVDNLPTLNVAKAGSAIPVKFSLAGDQGLDIFWTEYPKSASTACDGALTDGIEQTVNAGGSSLSYDAASDQYIYVWKTDKAWAGTCRTLTVQLADGTVHQANFKFTK